MKKQSTKILLAKGIITISAHLLLSACACEDPPVSANVNNQKVIREARLTTGQEVPPPTLPDSSANAPEGTAGFTLYSTNKLRGSITLSGFNLTGSPPASTVTAAHIHDGSVGTPGSVVAALSPDAGKVTWTLPANTSLTVDQQAKFTAGEYYVNVHTATNSAGLIRGQLLSFADNIQPIFSASCAVSNCHVAGGLAPMSLSSGAAWGSLVNAPAVTTTTGGIRVIADDAADSVLLKRLSGAVPPQMPLNRTPLSAAEQNLIRVWVDMGAANN